MLSAYEFSRHFHFKLARHPLSEAGHKAQQQNPSSYYHAGLTEAVALKNGKDRWTVQKTRGFWVVLYAGCQQQNIQRTE